MPSSGRHFTTGSRIDLARHCKAGKAAWGCRGRGGAPGDFVVVGIHCDAVPGHVLRGGESEMQASHDASPMPPPSTVGRAEGLRVVVVEHTVFWDYLEPPGGVLDAPK